MNKGILLAVTLLMLSGCGGDTASNDHANQLSHGQEIDLNEHVVLGSYTVYDFFSDYCPACVNFKPTVEELAEKNPEIVLKVINVNREGVRTIDWESPVSKQYHLTSLPHLKVFDKEGKMILEGPAAKKWVEAEYQKL